MNTPIFNRLEKYHNDNRVSFAMPGHKNARGLTPNLCALDTTELDAALNLHDEKDKTVIEAQQLLSQLYRSDESFILTGGSTAGIQAMTAAALNPGDTLLAGADCHMSVINTCALCGFNLRIIPADINEETLITHDAADIGRLLDRYNDIAAVLITSPNYYGICRDISLYASECHKRGIPLLVDEAHGAHFISCDKFPRTSIQCGADASVNSAHKTLNALTGAAYLHIKGRLINRTKIKAALKMFQSSSPSYPIAASADIARAQLEDGGGWNELAGVCNEFKKEISQKVFIKIADNDDPTRIVLNFSAFDTTGFEILHRLGTDYKIDAEMADMVNVVFIATPSNTRRDFTRLKDALCEICSDMPVRREKLSVLAPIERLGLISPQRAFYAAPQRVSADKCFNRISAVTVTAYPPGIPILCAGEEITVNHVLYIRHLKKAGAVFTNFDGSGFSVI